MWPRILKVGVIIVAQLQNPSPLSPGIRYHIDVRGHCVLDPKGELKTEESEELKNHSICLTEKAARPSWQAGVGPGAWYLGREQELPTAMPVLMTSS